MTENQQDITSETKKQKTSWAKIAVWGGLIILLGLILFSMLKSDHGPVKVGSEVWRAFAPNWRIKKGEKIATVSNNRPEWNFVDMGKGRKNCQWTGLPAVPCQNCIVSG